ncbi:MAG TPA: UDP-N-acetyl-D-mannosamine dehydrogenase, partial [Flavobacteriaceae bacterium]|nr:UDP-N-acetyl-D-mannosamine dehydrogenase [Flavobacteriaceae bacterium]
MQVKPSVVMMGLGYIGLPTAALIASRGLQVTGVDISEEVVNIINKGAIHIVEPDLEGLVHNVVKRGTLHATTKPIEADVYLIAVPTPFKENNVPNLDYVQQAVEAIVPCLKPDALVILESTSPIGTTEWMQKLVYELRPELKSSIYFAYCPERVLPGNIIYELKTNDRAIGGIDAESTEKAIEFYR